MNDLTTTNSNNNKQSTPFFLRPQLAPPPSLTLRPSQSLISLVDSSSSKVRCQSSKNRLISSRIANIIHQFESQTISLMNNSTKVSSPIRSVFVKQWEGTKLNGNSSPIVVVETSSPVSFNLKKTNKPQPIIICERITNHNRSIPSPIHSKTPLIKTWSQLKLMSQQQIIENDTTIHKMVNGMNQNSETLSRSSTSGTTDSTCSSSSSLSSNIPSPPRFARPTIASTQKQRQFLSNSFSFKRSNSPPSSITTFTRVIPPLLSSIVPLCSINEDLEQQTPTINNCFCSSEINLIERISTSEHDSTLIQNSITKNPNLPLRYKRDSFIRLYG